MQFERATQLLGFLPMVEKFGDFFALFYAQSREKNVNEGVDMSEFQGKERIIQEFVPGKQVTLAHVIANPDKNLYGKLGLVDASGAIGIMTITPSEGAMIAADVASKAADVRIGFVDRFNGSLVITGDVAAVEVALKNVMGVLCDMMGFAPTTMTKT